MQNPDLLFFTSDTHFGHRAMVERRQFPSAEAMDEELIARWNAVVPKNGTVYHLGDVSFRADAATRAILERLNGTICLVEGNHDRGLSAETKRRFAWVRDYYELKVDVAPAVKQRVVLCHFPLRVWNMAHYGAWHLHGHSHGNLQPVGRMLDVGVDSIGDETSIRSVWPPKLRPFTWQEIERYMEPRSHVIQDHH